jgi:hypothetical protein
MKQRQLQMLVGREMEKNNNFASKRRSVCEPNFIGYLTGVLNSMIIIEFNESSRT